MAWQRAIELVKAIYALTASFPPSEMYGLVSQMRRAAVSVPSNIAEGAARESAKEFANFLIIARGSLSELETQLRISTELGFFKQDEAIDNVVDEVFRLLAGLIKAQRQESPHA